MMMSLTSESTTVPSAPPMITPMASARAFVFRRNARNSPNTVDLLALAWPPRRRAGTRAMQPLESVRDGPVERLRFVDPALDHGLGRDVPDRVSRRVQLL